MIEDKELRDLFKIESDEHIQRLDDGLLRLEKTPDDAALIEEMFREAHSLKGAARMLGLLDIMNRAHQMEDTIGAAKRGETALTPEVLDGMYQGLNAIRDMVNAEVGQTNAEQPNADFGLRNADLKPESAEVTPSNPQSGISNPQSDVFHIDVVRVDPQNSTR